MTSVADLSLEQMKAYVDRLDAQFQAAVDDGTILEVTVARRDEVVSGPSACEVGKLTFHRWPCAARRTWRRFWPTTRSCGSTQNVTRNLRTRTRSGPTSCSANACTSRSIAQVGRNVTERAGRKHASLPPQPAPLHLPASALWPWGGGGWTNALTTVSRMPRPA